MSNHDTDQQRDPGPPDSFAAEMMDLRRRGVAAAERTAAATERSAGILADLEQMLRDSGFPVKARKHKHSGSGGFAGGGG